MVEEALIARRKKAFYRLCSLLRGIEADLDDFDAVKALNLGILKEIVRDEKHISRHRRISKGLRASLRNDRPERAEAKRLKTRVARADAAVKRYFQQIYIWKCIGDGLAYAYIHSVNIKHAFFDTESMSPRPKPGFIHGKDGLVNEIGLLFSAIEHKVPAVLCDITNVIRYGDVCLLGGSDPVPLEVKSSKGLNQRGKRQKAKLEKLTGFLENDVAIDFRGAPEVKRMAWGEDCRDCATEMNECVDIALERGFCAICPERGVVYFALKGGEGLDEIISNLGMEYPAICHLNMDKTDQNWAPYLPFMNSLRDLDTLYEFVNGNLSIFVCVDVAYLCEQLVMPGWKVSFLDDADLAFLLENDASGAKMAISRQFFGRLIFEFVSPGWFVEHEKSTIMRVVDAVPDATLPGVPLVSMEDMAAMFESMPKVLQRS